ncbi:hypothetical protein ACR3GG_000007 [Shigella sonnei]|uniref:Uncharacterized protein n=1 Tax=Salmonella phage PMBT29 TaxID=3137286 RepID=A0AAU8BXC5_9VIRU
MKKLLANLLGFMVFARPFPLILVRRAQVAARCPVAFCLYVSLQK